MQNQQICHALSNYATNKYHQSNFYMQIHISFITVYYGDILVFLTVRCEQWSKKWFYKQIWKGAPEAFIIINFS